METSHLQGPLHSKKLYSLNTFCNSFTATLLIKHLTPFITIFMNLGSTNIVVSALGPGWAPSNPWKCLMIAKGIPTIFKFKYEPQTAVREGENCFSWWVPYHIAYISPAGAMADMACIWYPWVHFTNGFWTHNWTPGKNVFASVMSLFASIMSLSGHKWTHITAVQLP